MQVTAPQKDPLEHRRWKWTEHGHLETLSIHGIREELCLGSPEPWSLSNLPVSPALLFLSLLSCPPLGCDHWLGPIQAVNCTLNKGQSLLHSPGAPCTTVPTPRTSFPSSNSLKFCCIPACACVLYFSLPTLSPSCQRERCCSWGMWQAQIRVLGLPGGREGQDTASCLKTVSCC